MPRLECPGLNHHCFSASSVPWQVYEAFFATVSHWAMDLAAVAEIAMREASTNGVEAMDALHVAAAASVGASKLITTEKPSRSIHRARAVKVVTIYPEA
jgi:predicted nucleic acid-binding protein